MAAASRPPFSPDTCFRTALISRMAAPDPSSSRCSSRFSSKLTPSAGRQASAELPPVKHASTTSSGPAVSASCISRCAARQLASVGSGCPADSSSIRSSDTACPSGATTTPPAITSPSSCSRVVAIRALALPAPSTSTLPPGPGMCETPSTITAPPSPSVTAARTAASGSAARTPASTMSSTSSRSGAGPPATSASRLAGMPEPVALIPPARWATPSASGRRRRCPAPRRSAAARCTWRCARPAPARRS